MARKSLFGARAAAVALACVLAAMLMAWVMAPNPVGATMPGKNGKIAFVAWETLNSASAIYTMNPDGSGLWRFIPSGDWGGGEYYGGPAWSPDGQKIAFWQAHSVDEYTTIPDGIHVMNANGSGVKRLVSDGGGPQWLPNGRKISFERSAEGSAQAEIYLMNTDGSSIERLASIPGQAHTWSPDGRKIAFICSARPWRRDWEICVMNSDGSNVKRLTRNQTDDFHPDWSPDGRKIVFSRFHKENGTEYQDEIHVMNADGSRERRLTKSPGSQFDPVWSPDGRKIAFLTYGLPEPGIYVMNADGRGKHQILSYYEFGFRFDSLAWQPLSTPSGEGG